MTGLSLLIPARNEEFLQKTIEDALKNIRGDTEIIAVLDGYWPNPPINDHPRVKLIHNSVSVGQRAATNQAAALSRAKYVMKVDAHCAFDEGFDVKMMAEMHDDWTMVPIMRNLHVFDWVCANGHRLYQGPTPAACPECGGTMTREMVWIAKPSPQSKSYCFDPTPHFQYFREYNKRPEGQGDITETMSLQGSCFMLTREKYHELNICDEEFGSWGSQGIEVSVKTWLSGGRVVCNQKTWYAHLFRTQGNGFGFPYPLSNNQVDDAKKKTRELFFNNKWPKQTRPLSWLIERFWPVPGWSYEDLEAVRGRRFVKSLKRDFIYYTDNQLDEKIAVPVRKRLSDLALFHNAGIISVSLKPLDFGENIVLDLERGVLTMFKQILAGLEASKADIVFFTEHDILYHPSHFDFIPPRKDAYYYNENTWKVDAKTGQALFYYTKQVSGLCAWRELLVEHYRKRVAKVEADGYSHNMGYEPGCHRPPHGVDNYPAERWMSEFPNVDIRHNNNLTRNRWSQDQFRNKNSCLGWTMADEVPGWGVTKLRFNEFLEEVTK